jgi:hypothetical protein
LELEIQFRRWLSHERLLESLSIEQLNEYACLGRLPDPLPDPPPRAESKVKGLDRKSLMQLWKDDLPSFALLRAPLFRAFPSLKLDGGTPHSNSNTFPQDPNGLRRD